MVPNQYDLSLVKLALYTVIVTTWSEQEDNSKPSSASNGRYKEQTLYGHTKRVPHQKSITKQIRWRTTRIFDLIQDRFMTNLPTKYRKHNQIFTIHCMDTSFSLKYWKETRHINRFMFCREWLWTLSIDGVAVSSKNSSFSKISRWQK